MKMGNKQLKQTNMNKEQKALFNTEKSKYEKQIEQNKREKIKQYFQSYSKQRGDQRA